MAIRGGCQRVLLTFSTICLIASIFYVAWTFLSCWQAQRRLRQEIHDREVQDARKVVEQYASGHLRILAFYANPPSLKRGEQANLCFGLDSAAVTRCVSISSAATTEYTLTAGGAGGKTVSETVTVSVGTTR